MTEHQLFCLFEPLNGSEGFCALKKRGFRRLRGLRLWRGRSAAHPCAGRVDGGNRTHLGGGRAQRYRAADCGGYERAGLPGAAALLPAREVSFVRSAASSRDLTIRRLETIGRLVTGQLHALVLPADAWMHRLMPRAQFEKHIIHVSQTDRLDPRDLTARLAAAGYENVHMVEAHGQLPCAAALWTSSCGRDNGCAPGILRRRDRFSARV